MTTVGSDNKFPKVFLEEVANDGSATDIPVADHRALFVGEDGSLHLKDSAAVVTTIAAGGYAPGGTDVAVADGGTGASTAGAARTNLGLVIGTDVQAFDADIATVAGSQAEMEAGTEAALRSMSPLRVAQAIAALGGGGGSANAHNENEAAVLVNATSTGDAGSRADHFPGTSLDAAWAAEANALTSGPTVKYSSLFMRNTNSNGHHRLRPYTPSGAFRVEARVRIGHGTSSGVGLLVRDSATGDVTGEMMMVLIAQGAGANALAYSVDAGAYTQRGSSSIETGAFWATGCYLAVERNGSNAWTIQVSPDRAGWVDLVAGHSKTFTVAKVGFRVFGPCSASVDFFDVVS